MMRAGLRRGVYLITEHERLDFPQLLARTEAALAAGVSALQYRNKSAGPAQRRREAEQLMDLCRDQEVPFIVNDDVDLALELGAEGVHIGREDGDCAAVRMRVGNGLLIGVSCYNELARADAAVAGGADYIAFGAMFATSSKQNTVKASTSLLGEAKLRYDVPVVTIGGITPDNCGPLIEAGADLLAVISSVYLAPDPVAVIETFNRMMVR